MAIGSTRLAGNSSAAGSHAAWVRWLVPSAADLFFVAMLGTLALTTLSVRLLGDAGIGWHIRTGQMILATHAVPRVDPFSTLSGQPWFAWEWLYDVVVGWLEKTAGLNGVVVFTAVIIAGVFSWTFRLLLRRGANIPVALVLVLLAASASMIHFLARPHVVSWLFTVAWFRILEASDHAAAQPSRPRLLWLLPLLMLVWVNVHGGFLLGFVLLAIYWWSAVWQWFRLKEDRFDDVLQKIGAGRRIRDLALTGLLTATASLVNPYGYKLHAHIYRYLSNRFLMDHIDEFQSPNFHYVAQKCFAGLLLLTLVALVVKRQDVGASRGLVVLFAVYSGLYASRNIPVASLLLILVIGPWLSDATDRLQQQWGARKPQALASPPFLQRMQATEFELQGHVWPIAATALALWVAAHGGRLGATPLMDAQFSAKRFPVAAVDYLEQQHVTGPIASTDYWGGYLIYRLYPRVRVVVDDRHDFYGEDFLKSYLKMTRVEPGWEDFLQKHPAQCLLVPKNSALANILLETPGWKPIYTDDVAVAFVRTSPQRLA
jgi:hypothetical protein